MGTAGQEGPSRAETAASGCTLVGKCAGHAACGAVASKPVDVTGWKQLAARPLGRPQTHRHSAEGKGSVIEGSMARAESLAGSPRHWSHMLLVLRSAKSLGACQSSVAEIPGSWGLCPQRQH